MQLREVMQDAKQVYMLKELVEQSLDEDSAMNVRLIDIRGQSSIADYVIIASGRSSRHVSSIADNTLLRLKRKGFVPLGTSGMQGGQWSIIDYGDIIVHVFSQEIREYYQLEDLWAYKNS